MGEQGAFVKYKRKDVRYRPVDQRIKDFREVDIPLTPEEIKQQAARCMDCGIPFCHGLGCPLKNRIPEFNDLLYKGRWQQACAILHSTNNFPEITARICPAPCETACTLSVNDQPVMIKQAEFQIVEKGFSQGWIVPQMPKHKTGKKVAVVGSGPAALAVAQQLVRKGHDVVVFEKDEQVGGLLRYGIPDFKLEKHVIDRRIEQLKAEGIEFQTGVQAGVDISANYLKKMFDCICLATGAGKPRDLNVDGRQLTNVLFAMEYLSEQNRINSGEISEADISVSAKDKVVVVIGGGDTGSDCVGTARRQGAKKIYQLEILPKPPETRPLDTPWPDWPRIMRTSSSHQEGCDRKWSVTTKQLTGIDGNVSQLHGCLVEWQKSAKGYDVNELKGTDFVLDADIVLLALGFLHTTHQGLIDAFELKLDQRGNVAVDNYQTSRQGVFAAGDTTTGASLVVRAIDSGRKAALAIDQWLKEQG